MYCSDSMLGMVAVKGIGSMLHDTVFVLGCSRNGDEEHALVNAGATLFQEGRRTAEQGHALAAM